MRFFDRFRRKPKQKSWVQTDQGMMNTNWDAGWWQQNLQPLDMGKNETVEACVSTLSQTVAMLPINHYRNDGDGEEVRQFGSGPERVLLSPNPYTSRSLFFNQIIRSVYFYGNGYAVATRDNNRAVNGLYVVDPKSVNGIIDPDSGEVFYWVSNNLNGRFNPENDLIYPARDVLNIRINPKMQEPLKGETPITVAANAISANSAITGHQSRFFNNMSRPSGVLATDEKLNREQMVQLREAYEAQSKGDNSGRVPILGYGMKWQPMSLTSQDAQMVEAFSMTVESISRVFRVPLPLINSMVGSTFNNAEAMGAWFLSSGLGFLLEHIELELNQLFGLPFKERLNFQTKALLRSDWKTQIEALSEGVINGIYSPNEARAMQGLGAVEDGDEPRVQQQVVPLSAWDQSTNEPQPVVDVAASFIKGFDGD